MAFTMTCTLYDEGQTIRGESYITLSGTYSTGGVDVSGQWKGYFYGFPRMGLFANLAGWNVVLDVANKKLLLWNGTTEFTNGGDLTGIIVYGNIYINRGV